MGGNYSIAHGRLALSYPHIRHSDSKSDSNSMHPVSEVSPGPIVVIKRPIGWWLEFTELTLVSYLLCLTDKNTWRLP